MMMHSPVDNMIKQQLRTNNVLDEKILELFDTIPRDHFAPKTFAPFAYSDMQIPLSHGQRMMTPVEEGKLLQSLALTGKETVLEVGTGSGFLTCLLSHLAEKVISVEYFPELHEQAKKNLAAQKRDNIELIHGDGCNGWFESAPYDIVILTAALDKLEEAVKLQVLPGGKLFALVGRSPVMQAQLHSLDHEGNWQQTLVFETDLPAMINKSEPREFIF